MTLLQPRTEPAPQFEGDAEALIREARRLRRRRWTIGVLAAAVIATCIGLVVIPGELRPSSPATSVHRHRVISRDFRPGLPEGPYVHLKVAGPLAVSTSGALWVADVDREQILVRLSDGRFRV